MRQQLRKLQARLFDAQYGHVSLSPTEVAELQEALSTLLKNYVLIEREFIRTKLLRTSVHYPAPDVYANPFNSTHFKNGERVMNLELYASSSRLVNISDMDEADKEAVTESLFQQLCYALEEKKFGR